MFSFGFVSYRVGKKKNTIGQTMVAEQKIIFHLNIISLCLRYISCSK